MDNMELILTDLSEEATKRLAQKQKPQGLKENIEVARKGGNVAKATREQLEENLGESVVTNTNRLNYEYVKEREDNVSALIWNELKIASALHDCGKPFTQTYKDSKGNDSEYAHYYNHENVGSYNSLFYCDDKDEYFDGLTVAALIRWHMVLHFFKDWEQKTIEKYEKEFTSHKWLQEMEFYKALKILHEGDKNAH
jgi:hypothetical protein